MLICYLFLTFHIFVLQSRIIWIASRSQHNHLHCIEVISLHLEIRYPALPLCGLDTAMPLQILFRLPLDSEAWMESFLWTSGGMPTINLQLYLLLAIGWGNSSPVRLSLSVMILYVDPRISLPRSFVNRETSILLSCLAKIINTALAQTDESNIRRISVHL